MLTIIAKDKKDIKVLTFDKDGSFLNKIETKFEPPEKFIQTTYNMDRDGNINLVFV